MGKFIGQGSGLYGSLKSGDLAAAGQPAAVAAPPAPGAAYTDIPLTSMREAIAKRLSLSKQTIPHYQLTVIANVEKLLEMRKRINEKLQADKSDVKVYNLFKKIYFLCWFLVSWNIIQIIGI